MLEWPRAKCAMQSRLPIRERIAGLTCLRDGPPGWSSPVKPSQGKWKFDSLAKLLASAFLCGIVTARRFGQARGFWDLPAA